MAGWPGCCPAWKLLAPAFARLCVRGCRLGFFRPVALGQPPLRTRGFRSSRSQEQDWRKRNKTALTYIAAAAVGMVGLSYAAVPLYRLYCQATGLGGVAVAGHSSDQIESMEPIKDRIIKVTFNADVHASLHWNFKPQQTEIYVVPGETALAFYKARNSTDKPVIGISTYNVVPFEAGQYFNKIQGKWIHLPALDCRQIVLLSSCVAACSRG
ncbi:cytochrome c oxidase assembly protein COX11, mitochondrial isoform X2 [Rhinatrema bivittatum]|uniref:cytochrome c oxidase assembly protein COX11, mitochondrial isoform X2 n=1 Tax=Rhinatrema bivittatum TaxID=194408 RepID=UPI00112A514D|nr:cytochrome c oxidase assembly protein COX11, mitochondrial isoform X2 [Rhinatrema bivittatum]